MSSSWKRLQEQEPISPGAHQEMSLWCPQLLHAQSLLFPQNKALAERLQGGTRQLQSQLQPGMNLLGRGGDGWGTDRSPWLDGRGSAASTVSPHTQVASVCRSKCVTLSQSRPERVLLLELLKAPPTHRCSHQSCNVPMTAQLSSADNSQRGLRRVKYPVWYFACFFKVCLSIDHKHHKRQNHVSLWLCCSAGTDVGHKCPCLADADTYHWGSACSAQGMVLSLNVIVTFI